MPDAPQSKYQERLARARRGGTLSSSDKISTTKPKATTPPPNDVVLNVNDTELNFEDELILKGREARSFVERKISGMAKLFNVEVRFS